MAAKKARLASLPVFLFSLLSLAANSQTTVTQKAVKVAFKETVVTKNSGDFHALNAADLDGDGDLDVLAGLRGTFSDKFYWYENQGNQTFKRHLINKNRDPWPRSVDAADLDGDGDMDVATASSKSNKIAWYENDGNGNFTTHHITFTAMGVQSVHITDLDKDGDKDLLSAHSSAAVVNWFENDGNGNFTSHNIARLVGGVRSAYAKDLNGNNQLDVMSADYAFDEVSWYENDSSQNFKSHKVTRGVDGVTTVHSGDLTGNGYNDIVSTNFHDDNVAWYENDGNGNFTKHIFNTPDGPIDVQVKDVTGNGHQDILVAFQWGDETKLFKNLGNKNFVKRTVKGFDHAKCVHAADVDQDGVTDVLSAYKKRIVLSEKLPYVDLDIAVEACGSYQSPSGKHNWQKSGVYYDTVRNSDGLDSFLKIDLSIKQPTSSSTADTVCKSLESPSGNYTWTKSGTYQDTLQNAQGCDSTITFDLKVKQPTRAKINPTVCDSFISPSGRYSWSKTGKYYDTIPNHKGCDSVIEINLTVNQPSSSQDTFTACDSFISPSGQYTWTSSGTYRDTIQNVKGCDSVITLDLTVHESSTSKITPTVCDSFESPSGELVWSKTGVYYDTLPNARGCDSVITVDLTVNKTDTTQINRRVCDSFIPPSGQPTYRQSGIYYDTLRTQFYGCDSIIEIDLTVDTLNPGLKQNNDSLIATSKGGQYQWIRCDTPNKGKINGATGRIFMPKKGGDYAVIVSKNQCQDTSSCKTFKTVGIRNLAKDKAAIYPNPTKEDVTVAFRQFMKDVRVRLSDLTGKRYFQKQLDKAKRVRIAMPEAKGVYLLHVQAKGSEATYKVIKY